MRGPPKGCGMKSYLKLAKSHTRVLKKVSDIVSNAAQESTTIKESNAEQESNILSSFSAMLKIVEYSDSEHSGSPTKISSSEGHPGAKPLSPQEAYLDVHDTLHKEAAYSIWHPGAEPFHLRKHILMLLILYTKKLLISQSQKLMMK